MLKYLEQLTVDLMIPAIVIGMLYAFIKFKLGKPCRMIYLAGGGFSVAASVFVAIQKNTNRGLKLPFWNGFTYIILSVLVISSAVFILSMFVWLAVKKARKATRFFVTAAAATVTFTAIVGGVAGYFMGYGFAQIIGQTVFNSSIEMKPMVIPIVAVLIVIVTLAGSIPAIRMLLRLRPAEVLHGR